MVGTPRSGTTLVQRLACELPGVVVGPETHFFTEFIWSPPDGDGFPVADRRLAAWLSDYAARPYMRGVEVDTDEVFTRLGGRCDSVLGLFAALAVHLAGGEGPAGDKTVGEKTPGHLLWWQPLARCLPDLRLVAVVRDPRAVVASHLALGWSHQPAAVAQRWRLDADEVAAAAGALGPRLLCLRYEDVVLDPGGARVALAAHLGLGPPPGPAEPRGEPEVAMFAGWETWKAAVQGELDPGRATAWTRELGAGEAGLVGAICGPAMERLGYQAGGRAPSWRMSLADRAARSRQRLRRRRRRRGIARLSRGWVAPV